MSISITDLRTKVRDMSGFVDNNVVTDDQLDDILNECYFNIASKADWPWLEISQSTTFAAGQDSFTFSNSSYLDLSRVVEAKVLVEGQDEWYHIFERPGSLMNEELPSYNALKSGTPKEFIWDGAFNNFVLYPATDREVTVSIRFACDPTSVDFLLIPLPYVQGLVYLAASRLLEREGDTSERVARFEFRSMEIVESMRKALTTSGRKTVRLGGRRNFQRGRRWGSVR